MEKLCHRCGIKKDEKEFWKIYTGSKTRRSVVELSIATQQMMESRHNTQRYCKECAGNWFQDNSWRRKGYNKTYTKKLKEGNVKRLYDLMDESVWQ